jgi:phosphohistidine phosphatase
MRLLLFRHAKAEKAKPGESDRERVLNPRGRADAPRVGTYLARHGLCPDYVLVSPAARTRETWALAASALSPAPPVELDDRLYDAGADDMLRVIRETPDDVRLLALVGHNPGMHELAKLLIASGDVEARERLREEMPTAALVLIDFALDGWKRLHPQAGRLERFVVPAMLTTATD